MDGGRRAASGDPGRTASAQLLTHIQALRRGCARGQHRRADDRLRRCDRDAGGGLGAGRGLAPAYGSTGGTPGMLAFVRQEQGRFDEAGELAERRAGRGARGRACRRTPWRTSTTRRATTTRGWLARRLDRRAAAARRLAPGPLRLARGAARARAGRRRPCAGALRAQLAPPAVHGVRALVDSASLLWRARLRRWRGRHCRRGVRCWRPSPPTLLTGRATAFAALHAAVALAAAGDCQA